MPDVSGSGGYSIRRITKIDGYATVIESRSKIIDNSYQGTVLSKTGFNAAAKDEDAVNILFEFDKRKVAARVSYVEKEAQMNADLVGEFTRTADAVDKSMSDLLALVDADEINDLDQRRVA